MLVYTALVHWTFRGKARLGEGYYQKACRLTD
jgi:hypothetical protein